MEPLKVSFFVSVYLYIYLLSAYVGDEDNTQVRIIVGATVGAFVVIAVIIGMTLLFLRRCGIIILLPVFVIHEFVHLFKM